MIFPLSVHNANILPFWVEPSTILCISLSKSFGVKLQYISFSHPLAMICIFSRGGIIYMNKVSVATKTLKEQDTNAKTPYLFVHLFKYSTKIQCGTTMMRYKCSSNNVDNPITTVPIFMKCSHESGNSMIWWRNDASMVTNLLTCPISPPLCFCCLFRAFLSFPLVFFLDGILLVYTHSTGCVTRWRTDGDATMRRKTVA